MKTNIYFSLPATEMLNAINEMICYDCSFTYSAQDGDFCIAVQDQDDYENVKGMLEPFSPEYNWEKTELPF